MMLSTYSSWNKGTILKGFSSYSFKRTNMMLGLCTIASLFSIEKAWHQSQWKWRSPRRVEGRDKNDDSKKNLQLKVRKLSPIHTISYVRVYNFVPCLCELLHRALIFSNYKFFSFKYWGLKWILNILHLLLCFSSIIKDYIQCWGGKSSLSLSCNYIRIF